MSDRHGSMAGGLEVILYGRGLGWAAATAAQAYGEGQGQGPLAGRLAAAAVLAGSETKAAKRAAAATVAGSVVLVGGRPCSHTRVLNTTAIACTTSAGDHQVTSAPPRSFFALKKCQSHFSSSHSHHRAQRATGRRR